MAESWREIEGWPYEVSDLGRIRRIGGRVLAPRRRSNGYSRVYLCNGKERFEVSVHRLVCSAFHGEPPNPDDEVDHINEIRDDNRAKNLRWASIAENRARRRLAHGEAHQNSKLTEQQVRFIRSRENRRGDDRRLAEQFGVARETIRDIRNGRYWNHVAD